MSLKDNLDEFLAKEGWYEVEGAGLAERHDLATSAKTSPSVAQEADGRHAPSCSHRVRDLVSICRKCGDGIEIEADHAENDPGLD